MYVDFVREGEWGNGAARSGNPRWIRLTERRARTAKSVFRFDVQGSVAKSTHSGLPWLLFIRRRAGGASPLLAVRWMGGSGQIFSRGGDLSTIVEPELSEATVARPISTTPSPSRRGCKVPIVLDDLLSGSIPNLTPDERAQAQIEGWILGIP